MALWLMNLNHGGSEPGAPVGGVGAGQQLMMLFVGRCWWAAILLSQVLRGIG